MNRQLGSMERLCAASVLVIMISVGCATKRSIQVVDDLGQPVVDSLVLYREYNLTIYQNGVGLVDVDEFGRAEFNARKMVWLEALGPGARWGKLILGGNRTGTVIVSNAPYDGRVSEFVLRKSVKRSVGSNLFTEAKSRLRHLLEASLENCGSD